MLIDLKGHFVLDVKIGRAYLIRVKPGHKCCLTPHNFTCEKGVSLGICGVSGLKY